MNITEAANWTDQQCAEHLVEESAGLVAEFGRNLCLIVAANNIWAESAGNLHKFAERFRKGDDEATDLVLDAMGRRNA